MDSLHAKARPDYDDLIKEHLPRIKAVVRNYSQGDDQQDLLQEVLFQLWKGLDNFKAESQVQTWVYRVALNTCISHLRRASVRVALQTGMDLTLDQEVSEENWQSSAGLLEAFLQELDELNRGILLMYLDNLSQSEMAEILGLSVSAVGVRISRMKQAFIKFSENWSS